MKEDFKIDLDFIQEALENVWEDLATREAEELVVDFINKVKAMKGEY